jgi:hypothetical protein
MCIKIQKNSQRKRTGFKAQKKCGKIAPPFA